MDLLSDVINQDSSGRACKLGMWLDIGTIEDLLMFFYLSFAPQLESPFHFLPCFCHLWYWDFLMVYVYNRYIYLSSVNM